MRDGCNINGFKASPPSHLQETQHKASSPLHHFAILANQELREVPLDIIGQNTSLLTLKEVV